MPANRWNRWNLIPAAPHWVIAGTDYVLDPAPGTPQGQTGAAARHWAGEILKAEGQMTQPPLWTTCRDNQGEYYEPSVTPDDLNGGGVRTFTGPDAGEIAGLPVSERADRLREQIAPKINVVLTDDEIKALLRSGRLQFVAGDTAGRRVDITINWMS